MSGGTGTDAAGVAAETTSDPQGGNEHIAFIQDGDWWSFDPANLSNLTAIRLRASSGGPGGTVQIRAGDPETGTLVGSVEVPPTGGWQTFTDVTLDLTEPLSASGPLYFVVRKPTNAADDAYLINVNWVDFVGKGATDNQHPVVTATATPVTGVAPLQVAFTATATDPEDDPLTYKWNFGVAGCTRAHHRRGEPHLHRAGHLHRRGDRHRRQGRLGHRAGPGQGGRPGHGLLHRPVRRLPRRPARP